MRLLQQEWPLKRLSLSIIFLLVCSRAYADVSTGLVLWWKFDEGSGTSALDSSGNANTGTLQNTPTWVAGHIGSHALSFVTASGQCVQSTTATNIPNINGAGTFSAWVNANASGAGTVRDILVTTNTTNAGNQLRINGGNNAEVSQWAGPITITAGAVSTGTWHMITWTTNGTNNNIIYIDGVQSGNTTTTNPQTGTPSQVFVGAYATGTGKEDFWGTIDDVRIYNRTLSASDVKQLYTFYTGRNGFFTLLSR